MNLPTLISMMSWLDIATVILSIYVVIESLSAVTSMPEGYAMFCHKLKYVLAFTSALALIYFAFRLLNAEMQWLIFGISGTLASFVWPRMVWRLTALLDDLVFFEQR